MSILFFKHFILFLSILCVWDPIDFCAKKSKQSFVNYFWLFFENFREIFRGWNNNPYSIFFLGRGMCMVAAVIEGNDMEQTIVEQKEECLRDLRYFKLKTDYQKSKYWSKTSDELCPFFSSHFLVVTVNHCMFFRF